MSTDATITAPDREPMRNQSKHWYELSGAVGLIAWIASGSMLMTLALHRQDIRDELGPDADLFFPMSVASITFMLACIPAGWLADRFSSRKLVVYGLLFAGGAQILYYFGQSIEAFAIGGGLDGLARSLLPLTAIMLLSPFAPDIRGTLVGFGLLMSLISSSAVPLFAMLFNRSMEVGWRADFLLSAAVFFAIALVGLIAARGRTNRNAQPQVDENTLPRSAIVHLMMAALLLIACLDALMNANAVFLRTLDETTRRDASTSIGLVSLLGISIATMGAVVVGFLHTTRAKWIPRLIAIACGLTALLALPAFVSDDPIASINALSWAQLFGGTSFAIILSTVACWTPSKSRGLMLGIVFAAHSCAGYLMSAMSSKFGKELGDDTYRWCVAGVVVALICWSLVNARLSHTAIKKMATPSEGDMHPVHLG